MECHLSIFLLLCLFLFQRGEADRINQQAAMYCVSTDETSNGISCHTLKYYMRNSSLFFKNNSTFIFMPGEHLTDCNCSLTVQNVSGLVLRGQNATIDYATINCNKQQNYFKFKNVSDLSIQGLNFSECGQKSTSKTTGNATLIIANSSNVDVSMTVIYMSEYQGLYFSNVLGVTSIAYSSIIKCRTDRYYTRLNSYPANGIYYSICPINSSLKILNTTL